MEPIKHKILLVDDDLSVLDFLSYNLEKKGFEVQTATNGHEALAAGVLFLPDIIVLDWMMPEMDGLQACQQFRANPIFDQSTIAFLTAKDDDFSKIEGFRAGADDFIHKSIKPLVFVAKIEALLRRKQLASSQKEVISIYDLEVFPQKRMVKKAGNLVDLTKIEFNLLLLFLSNKDKVFSRQEIHAAIWGSDVIIGDRTLDVHILNLRKKVGKLVILTSKGIGYTLG